METLLADLRLALRSLRTNPGFTFVALAALTIGIGSNTGIFSVVNKVLLQPLPYPDPARLVQVAPKLADGSLNLTSIPNFMVWRNNDVFSSMALYNLETQEFNLSGDRPRQIVGLHVSLDFFRVFGASPIVGRTFTQVEDQPNGPKSAVISESLWRSRFGSDPNILASTITLNSESYPVVGVIPSSFASPVEADVWVPLQADPNTTSQAHFLTLTSRLKPGVSLGQARGEMRLLGERFRRLYPKAMEKGESVDVVPMREAVVGDVKKALYVLSAAVALVLLIACANVASLLIARASVRRRELAIRAAIGASRWRVVRQLLTESILLSMIGGLLGLVFGIFGVRALLLLVPGDVPRIGSPEQLSNPFALLDWRILVFTIGVSFLTSILFGLFPALQISNPDLAATLKESGTRSSTGRHQNMTRKILVAVEMALALVLLTSAVLLIRSFVGLSTVRTGIDSHQVFTTLTTLSGPRYKTTQDLDRFTRNALQRIQTIPGVQAAACTIFLPTTSDAADLDVDIPGRTPPAGHDHSGTEQWRSVTSGYFHVFRIPLQRGREFGEQDTAMAPLAAVVNVAFVQKYFPNENPVGKQIQIAKGFGTGFEEPPREIVGVVGNVREAGLTAGNVPVVYVPLSQQQEGITKLFTSTASLAWAIRANRDQRSLAGAIETAIQTENSQLPLGEVQSMDSILHKSLARQSFNMLLLSMFAGSALLLAAIGIYGLMSYAVQQQSREIGVRMALGAGSPDILRLVMIQAMAPTLIGVAVGLAIAFSATRLMESLLYEVKANDPLSFFAVAMILILVAIVAVLIPVRRAMSVHPMTALRIA